MVRFSEPRIIERGPYQVVGAYCTFEGEDEGPGWAGSDKEFNARRKEIANRVDTLMLGFLYQPHWDHPEIPESVRACFTGVEVTDLDHVPAGMAVTQFSGGKYVIMDCLGDTPGESANGLGEAIGFLQKWLRERGYVQGDACFACGDERTVPPPYVESVYIKLNQKNEGLA